MRICELRFATDEKWGTKNGDATLFFPKNMGPNKWGRNSFQTNGDATLFFPWQQLGAQLFFSAAKRRFSCKLLFLLRLFLGASAGAEGVVEVQVGGGFRDPGIAAEGTAATQAGFNALQFTLRDRLVDVANPVFGNVEGPICEEGAKLLITIEADVETCIRPEFGPADEV